MARAPKVQKHKKPKRKVEVVWSWHEAGWSAQIIENESGEGGWAVAMTRDGDDEPIYIAPWTMGRNKVDPKPLSRTAFLAWVKSASEFAARLEHQRLAADQKTLHVTMEGGDELVVRLQIHRDEYEATAELQAFDRVGQPIATCAVDPTFALSRASAVAWIEGGFGRPGGDADDEAFVDSSFD